MNRDINNLIRRISNMQPQRVKNPQVENHWSGVTAGTNFWGVCEWYKPQVWVKVRGIYSWQVLNSFRVNWVEKIKVTREVGNWTKSVCLLDLAQWFSSRDYSSFSITIKDISAQWHLGCHSSESVYLMLNAERTKVLLSTHQCTG